MMSYSLFQLVVSGPCACLAVMQVKGWKKHKAGGHLFAQGVAWCRAIARLPAEGDSLDGQKSPAVCRPKKTKNTEKNLTESF